MASDKTTSGRTDAEGDQVGLRELAQRLVQSTFGPRVMKLSGPLAGLFRLDYDEKILRRDYRNPVLVASQADARAKASLAIRLGRLRDVAIDVAAANVNDMLSIGAEPLFLLHHLAGGDLSPPQHLEVIDGLVEACRQAGCALLSGDRAEAAGSARPAGNGVSGGPAGHAGTGGSGGSAGQRGFDLVAFAVGVCDHRKLITGEGIEPGDDVIGVASSGLHCAGFDLAAAAAFEQAGLSPTEHLEQLGCTVGEELLRPSRIYVGPVLRVLRYYRRKRIVAGMAHVTGGGLAGSIERILPADCRVRLEAKTWPRPAIFDLLERWGVPAERMWQTLNMGIGYVLVVRPAFTQSIVRQLRRRKMPAWRIGAVSEGPKQVELALNQQ
jgi:phosphoribosylformylglycinamidine cyclo-ligase